ncbi:response regulator [Rhizobium ruizarguesonis]|uniref:response regulator n=1 Tax=Rhizobium ruizarguesonis TaxID=2081791 RepID=UPI00248490F9|nr:response regulator [Rhizobium ruizarguesonis]
MDQEAVIKHVMVVDDDESVRNFLTDYLVAHELRVTATATGRAATEVLRNDDVDLILIDLNLGHEDGLDLVKATSEAFAVPIIIISGSRLDETDKVVGLELGAADYITKPFGNKELLARIRVSLRSTLEHSVGRDNRVFTFMEWALLPAQRQLISPSGSEIKLTAGEFNLLTAFLSSPRRVLSREQLISGIRMHDDEIFDRTIDVHILRLRRKLQRESKHQFIKTERGAGYFFDADVTMKRLPLGINIGSY